MDCYYKWQSLNVYVFILALLQVIKHKSTVIVGL